MVGTCVEAAAMISFATAANESWDGQKDELDRAARGRLFSETEQAMTGLVAWTDQLHEELLVLQTSADSGPTSAVMELAAARMGDAAEAMLNGLLLPKSAEDQPGTARRLALDAFVAAAHELDEAAASSIGAQPGLSSFEMEIATVRLTAAGLRHSADRVNTLWDADGLTYRHATIHFEDLAVATAGLMTRIEAIVPPPKRVDTHAALRREAIELNRAAQAMLAGLLIPSEDEDLPGTMRRQALDEFRTASTAVDRAAALALGVLEDEWSPLAAGPGPHTSPPDVIAPPLEFTKPVSGAGVGTRSVTVKGTSEPHAAVTVGEKLTHADDDGKWSVKVRLDRGHNVLTVTATDLAGNETTAEYELHRGYLISGTRIGPSNFGDLPDDVLPWFIDTFGTPHNDELIILDEPNDPYGFWADSYFRIVTWRQPYVALLFADGNYYGRTDDQPGLVAWYTDSDAFVTSMGIHEGSTLVELQAAYSPDLSIATVAECSLLGEFWVTSTSFPRLRGQVSGPPFDADSVVTHLAGGAETSC